MEETVKEPTLSKHFSLEDARTLLEESEVILSDVNKYYRSSLIKKSVDKRLALRIKVLFDSLRSALDYCAIAMVDIYSNRKPGKTYFPYANKETTLEEFCRKGKYLDKAIPDLKEKNSELYEYLVSIQHFSEKRNQFVPEIFRLNNKNKHFRLIPSEYVDKIDVKLGGLHLHVNSLKMGDGAKITTNNGSVNGPVKVDSKSIPKSGKIGDASVNGWTGIKIDGFAFPLTAKEFSEYSFNYVNSVARTIYDLTL